MYVLFAEIYIYLSALKQFTIHLINDNTGIGKAIFISYSIDLYAIFIRDFCNMFMNLYKLLLLPLFRFC